MNLQFIFIVFAFSAFFIGASYALFTFLRVRYSRMRLRVDRRLDAISKDDSRVVVQLDRSAVLSSNNHFNIWLKRYKVAIWLHDALQKLGWKMRVDQFIYLVTSLFLVLFTLVEKVGGSFLLSFCFALIAAGAPCLYLKLELNKRQTKLELQLPEILNFISRAMQAGHTFIGSMQMAASESQDPIASEFQQAFQEISFGRSVQDAMSDLSKRIDCAEMRYFAVAVFINQEIGGNLASLINNVATLIRERIKAKMVLHAMTSEARASALILSVLPFCVALVMAFIRPDFVKVLWTDPSGRTMAGYALVLMVFGILWMQRLAKIRV